MTATIVLKKASRVNWLKHRRQGLGGTDIATIFGLNPWATPLDVWLSKTGRGEDRDPGYAARRGLHLESFLLSEYRRAHPGVILDKPPALLAHPDHPWLRASLDHLAHHPDETRIVECKTAGWRQRGDWWDSAILIPDSYAIQVLTYLAVTGLEQADIVADIAGDFTELTILRDREWEAQALPILEQWWTDHVIADNPPPVDYWRDDIPALNRTWVTEPGSTAEAPEATQERVKEAVALSASINELEALKGVLRVQIREDMGTHQTLTDPAGTPIARLNSRGVLTLAAPTSQMENQPA